jgi:F-type H+-transporting ATPase subunit delta
MNEGKISVRYAQALYALAEEKGIQQEIYRQMETLSQAFMEVPGLTAMLSNPMHSADEKLKLMFTASGCQKDSLLADYFRFVIQKEREEYLVFMAMSYQKIYREKQRIVMANITSALPLKKKTLDKIRQLVDNKFSATMQLSTNVDPDIIGGFILEVDNYRMDSSIQTELRNIEKELMRD